MAQIGASKPYFAIYSATGNTVTYSEGALMGKLVQLDIELDDADDNTLYADNGPAETSTTFSGGTVTITTDDLNPELMVDLLGLTEQTIETEGLTTTSPKLYVYNENQQAPDLGFGAIVKRQINNQIKWQAVILYRIKLSNPSDSFATQGETIEWGTPELSGTILRSDATGAPWKAVSSWLDSEADAEAVLKKALQIGAA